MSSRWRYWVIPFALCLAVASGKVLAQSISGSITGLVADASGQGLAGVAITVKNVDTQVTRNTSTDAYGNYELTELPAGTYAVAADLEFYRSSTHSEVSVSVGRTTVENFLLVKPPPNETLTVTSTAPPTDPTSATLSNVFSKTQIQTLPLLTRDANSLALLAPGVFSVRTFSFASTLVPFATNGARGRDNNFIIDSVDNNEPLFGGAATQFTNTDVFSDYSIITAVPKAEFGRGTGATVNVITRNGGNDIHGSAFWFGQNDLFNAADRVEQAAGLRGPAPFYENVAGGTIGGPLKKDHMWFFGSYQFDDARNDLSAVYPVVSTLPVSGSSGVGALEGVQDKSPALSWLLRYPSVLNSPTGSPCTTAMANPCSTNQIMLNGVQGLPSAVDYGTFLIPHGNLFDVRDHQLSGRLDNKISESQTIYGRYLFDDLHAPQSAFASPGVEAFDDIGALPEERNFLSQRTQSFLIDHRYYTNDSVNEFRFALSRVSQGVKPDAPLIPAATVGDNFGFTQFPYQSSFPSAGQLFTIGNDTSPAQSNSNIFQVQENYSRVVRQHTFKFGIDVVRTQTDVSSVSGDVGHYFFGSAGSSGGLSDFFTENSPVLPSSGERQSATNADAVFQRFTDVIQNGSTLRQGPLVAPLRETDLFLFAQDDIRLRPNLTLNLGLRYEAYGQPIDSLNALNSQAVPYVRPDHNNFAPRVGFAWSPWKNSNTVVRGGYGISYSPMVLNIPLLIWQSGPVSPLVYTLTAKGKAQENLGTIVPTTGIFPALPLSLSSLQGKTVSGCGSYYQETQPGSVPLINCSSQNTVSSNLVNPYVQNFTLGIQHEWHQTLLEVDGVGSKGNSLYQRVDLNPYGGYICDPYQACNNTGYTPLVDPCGYYPVTIPNDCLANRKDNSHGDVLDVTNGAGSTYYALQLAASRRVGSDFTFTAAYTWSHMIDDASEIFGPGIQFFSPNVFTPAVQDPRTSAAVEAITPLPQDSNDLAIEKGNSSFDRRHRLAISYTWKVPGRETGFAHGLLSGWQVSGISSIQSGQPFSALNSTPVIAGSLYSGADPFADANGDGTLTNDRPEIGNPKASLNSVALLTTDCPSGQSPCYPAGVNPANAHFVQWFGSRGTSGNPGYGLAGRNILTGPGIVNLDAAIYKDFKVGEGKTLQFRWEVYDLFNTPNSGFALGNVFASAAQAASGYAFSPVQTAARITGVIPENAIDAGSIYPGLDGFLNRGFMNTSSRRMQFGVKLIF